MHPAGGPEPYFFENWLVSPCLWRAREQPRQNSAAVAVAARGKEEEEKKDRPESRALRVKLWSGAALPVCGETVVKKWRWSWTEHIAAMGRTMFFALTVGMLLATCQGDEAVEMGSDNADCNILRGMTTYK